MDKLIIITLRLHFLRLWISSVNHFFKLWSYTSSIGYQWRVYHIKFETISYLLRTSDLKSINVRVQDEEYIYFRWRDRPKFIVWTVSFICMSGCPKGCKTWYIFKTKHQTITRSTGQRSCDELWGYCHHTQAHEGAMIRRFYICFAHDRWNSVLSLIVQKSRIFFYLFDSQFSRN